MRIPGRTLAVLNVQSNVKEIDTGQIYDVQVNPLLSHEHPNLSIVPTIHRVDCASPEIVPFVTINLSYDPIEIDKGMVMGFSSSRKHRCIINCDQKLQSHHL